MVIRFTPQAAGATAYEFDPGANHGYVWHCHIIDHEDNEMMRPYRVQSDRCNAQDLRHGHAVLGRSKHGGRGYGPSLRVDPFAVPAERRKGLPGTIFLPGRRHRVPRGCPIGVPWPWNSTYPRDPNPRGCP